MPLYEVHLIRSDNEETRLTDHPVRVGETVAIGEERWLVQHEAPPGRAQAAARYVCLRVDETQ